MQRPIEAFIHSLQENEYSHNTILKYERDLRKFQHHQGNRTITRKDLINYKEKLMERYLPTSVNSMLASLNRYLEFLGLREYKLKMIRIQKKIYLEEEQILRMEDYQKLLAAAKDDLCTRAIMETLCATGIRVSELRYITVENFRSKAIKVYNKGKARVIFLPTRLIDLLSRYIKKAKIHSGEIFVNRKGKRLDRTVIWRKMKRLCEKADVEKRKVFPHNLRHLFAMTYYRMKKDISKLADLLGHSSIETTRIYILDSSQEHYHDLERMHLVI